MNTVAVGLRVVAALAVGARPAYRPGSPVVHLFIGPATRSGRYGSAAGGTVCGTRTRRLTLGAGPVFAPDLGGRRFCRRCTSALPTSLGTDVHRLVARTDVEAAYGHLSLPALETAAQWTRMVDDTHLLARVAAVVLGPPKLFGTRDAYEQRIYDLDQTLIRRRDGFRVAEMTDEEREAAAARREADDDHAARVIAARRKEIAVARAVDRRSQGHYLRPHERELLDTA